jgi:hypothetical protein
MARIALQLFCVAALGAAVAAAQSGDRRALAARGEFRPDARRLSKTEDPDVLRAVFDPANAPLRTGPTRVCQPGAAWIRLEFAALRLEQGDRLSVRSDGGDHYEFSGGQWQGGPAHLRALRGACLDVQPHFAHSGSAYRLDGYRFAKFALTQSAVVVAAAGDICDTSGDACMRTSDTVLSIAPNAAILLGDNAYDRGTLSEYQTRYDPAWGRFKNFTRPVAGNHEYATPDAQGYFDYFNGVGAQTGLAGARDKGYYSWDLGEWHFVALNSNFPGGSAADLAQRDWLRADLAANTQPCTLAYFHHPMITVGRHTGAAAMRPYWDALYAARADLILVGHDHNYQRYGKLTPAQAPALDGIRQIVVGTGGRAFYSITRTHPALEAANADSFGVLKLTLTANSYAGEFVPAAGSAYTDRFSARCNKAAIAEVIQFANCRVPPKRILQGGAKTLRTTDKDSARRTNAAPWR